MRPSYGFALYGTYVWPKDCNEWQWVIVWIMFSLNYLFLPATWIAISYGYTGYKLYKYICMRVYAHRETTALRVQFTLAASRVYFGWILSNVYMYTRVCTRCMALSSLEWYIINCYGIGLSVKWLWSLCSVESSRIFHEYVPGLSLGAS